MIVARQSTARTVMVGPVLDADGVAVTDGVVGDFKISKNGGAPAALNGSATLTHRNTGHYSLALTASDLDTVGQAEVVIDDTVNACPMKELTVIEEAVYDALYAASAVGYVADQPVNVTKIGGDAQSATDLKDFADAGYDPATNKVQGVVLTDTVTTYTGNTPQTGDAFARLGAPAGASVSADIADVEGKVDDLETRIGTPSDLGSGATVAANLVDIESQTDDIGVAGAGLTNINLPDQTMNITGDITGNLSGSVGSVTGAVGSVTGNVGGNVTGSVGSVSSGGITRASFAAETGLQSIRSNTAQAGGASSITLDASASAALVRGRSPESAATTELRKSPSSAALGRRIPTIQRRSPFFPKRA
jgi:hypothetical protein